jgi:hypothetical protein
MTDFQCTPTSPDLVWVEADYYMNVGTTGIKFVAKLPAILRPWGPEFLPDAIKAAWLRAATTLGHMGLVSGQTFQFLRLGGQLTVAQAATVLGVPAGDITLWEAEVVDTPVNVWQDLSYYDENLDGRYMLHDLPVAPDFRPRVIRIYPEMPRHVTQGLNVPPPGNGCIPCP